MKISVLVPIYNVEKYIARCVNTLFEQTYADIEYIFVDDCSPDNSISILTQEIEKYPHRAPFVKIIHHLHNRGLSATRNTAIHEATGEYIVFVDSDDYLELDCLQKVANVIKMSSPDVILYGFNHIFPDKVIKETQSNSLSQKKYIQDIIERNRPVCVCGGAYRRRLFTDKDIWFIDGLNFGEDYAVKPRVLFYANRIVCIQDCLYNYVHSNPLSFTNVFREKDIDDQLKALRTISHFFGEASDDYRRSIGIAEIRIKSELFVKWGVSNGESASFQRILKMKGGIKYCRYLPRRFAITIMVSLLKSEWLMRNYVRYGLKLRQLFK